LSSGAPVRARDPFGVEATIEIRERAVLRPSTLSNLLR
jgi:hypothetical protein